MPDDSEDAKTGQASAELNDLEARIAALEERLDQLENRHVKPGVKPGSDEWRPTFHFIVIILIILISLWLAFGA